MLQFTDVMKTQIVNVKEKDTGLVKTKLQISLPRITVECKLSKFDDDYVRDNIRHLYFKMVNQLCRDPLLILKHRLCKTEDSDEIKKIEKLMFRYREESLKLSNITKIPMVDENE